MSACAKTRTPSRSRSTLSSSSSLPTNDVTSILWVAIVPPHLASSPLSMRMAVAFYITGISTSEFHRESPPLAGTLTDRAHATTDRAVRHGVVGVLPAGRAGVAGIADIVV